MSDSKNGGPAFPTPNGGEWGFDSKNEKVFCPDVDEGMSLRDWFAGKAIAALIQRETEISKFELLNSGFGAAREYDEDGQLICACPQTNDLSDDWEFWTEVAKSSYALADAMLRERNRKEESK